VLRWSLTRWERMAARCERILGALGTETIIPITGAELAAAMVTMQWRRPLSFAEIAQLAQTPEVRARPGRP
jgi:hypothetical protein